MKRIFSIIGLCLLSLTTFAAGDSVYVFSYKALYDEEKAYTDNDSMEVQLVFKCNTNNQVIINNLQQRVDQPFLTPYISIPVYAKSKTILDFSTKETDTIIAKVKLFSAQPYKVGNNTLVIWPNIVNNINVDIEKTGFSQTKLVYVEPSSTKNTTSPQSIKTLVNGKTVNVQNVPSNIRQLTVSDLTGKLILKRNLNGNSTAQINNLPNGILLISFYGPNLAITRKVIITRK